MDKKTKGAWVIHHGKKLHATTSQDFDQLGFAGKCGLLLSAISGGTQAVLDNAKVNALARATGISPRAELPAVLQELSRQKLINVGAKQVEVLGLTSAKVLDHTAAIFDEGNPSAYETAALEFSELSSERPIAEERAIEYVSDTFSLTREDSSDLLEKGAAIGFCDAESISDKKKLFFNGNLFRRDSIPKISAVLESLKPDESRLVGELNEQLTKAGCVTLQSAHRILGADLFKKLHSIALFDVNAIGNESGKHYFVTRPAAFTKFSQSIADDAFDLAKAMVSSLTYGMKISSYGRGRIQMISALMNRLISGQWVGPATAIGKDYQALELRGVIEVRQVMGSRFSMRLLKPEVGRLALAVIQEGEATTEVISQLPGAQVTNYIGPEENRAVIRKNATAPLRQGIGNILNDIRTGVLKR